MLENGIVGRVQVIVNGMKGGMAMKQLHNRERTKKLWLSVFGSSALLILIIGLLVFFLSKTESTRIMAEYDAAGNPVYISTDSAQAVYSLYNETETTLGKFINLRGQVKTLPQKENGEQVFTLNGEPSRGGGETRIYFRKLPIVFSLDSYVQVTGYVRGVENNVPIIEAIAIQKLPAVQVLRPAFLEYDIPDQSQSQAGIVVTATRIEYSYEETRIFVTVQNQTNEPVRFEWGKATAQVGEQTFASQSVMKESSDLALPRTINGYSKVNGLLVFPPMNPFNTVVRIPSSSFTNDFQLNLPVPEELD